MANRLRLEKSQTVSLRLAAYSLLILFAFLMTGCQAMRLAASPAPAASACGEGMLAAQAWRCLASGAARP